MSEKSYLCSKYFDRKSQKYKIKNLQKIYTSPESWVNSFKNNIIHSFNNINPETGGLTTDYLKSENQYVNNKETYDKLKASGKEVQYNCGRPGVNGGHITNPYIKFGVNCFGKKPDATSSDIARLEMSDYSLPQTAEQKELQAKIDYWKANAAELLQISSFNKDKWSRND